MLKKKYPKKPCALDGCDMGRQLQGYCKRHYRIIVLGKPPFCPKEKRIPTTTRRKTPIPCEVDGCDRMAKSKDMCSMHYSRVRRHGDPGVNYHRKYRSNIINLDNVLRPHMNYFSTANEKEALGEIFQEKNGYREQADIYY